MNVTDSVGHPLSVGGKSGSSFVTVDGSSYCGGAQIGTIASDWFELLDAHLPPGCSFKPTCTLSGADEGAVTESSSRFKDFDSYLQPQCNYPQVSLSKNLDCFSKIR